MENFRASKKRMKTARVFAPGNLVPISGVYQVVHLTEHRAPHDVIASRGEQVPTCRICKAKVRFRVVQVISHMCHDWDLAGPAAA